LLLNFDPTGATSTALPDTSERARISPRERGGKTTPADAKLILVPPRTTTEPTRCAWAPWHELMLRYDDEEWGVPSHDDRHLFEMLTLEGAQAGLSWTTILNKRENYRRAFDGFDVGEA